MDASVRVEKLGPVTVVTLDRPEVRNAVDAPTARRLYDAFVAFDADEEACVAVFHGAHGHFCAGWDLQFGAQVARQGGDALPDLDFDPARVGQGPMPLGPMGPSRLLLDKPVVAAVSGAAVAGGMELALWCDLRVMEEDAYFGVYCRRFGVPLIDGGTVRLPRLVGMWRARGGHRAGRATVQVPAGDDARGPDECLPAVGSGAAASAAFGVGAQQAPHRRWARRCEPVRAWRRAAREVLTRRRPCESRGQLGVRRPSGGWDPGHPGFWMLWVPASAGTTRESPRAR